MRTQAFHESRGGLDAVRFTDRLPLAVFCSAMCLEAAEKSWSRGLIVGNAGTRFPSVEL